MRKAVLAILLLAGGAWLLRPDPPGTTEPAPPPAATANHHATRAEPPPSLPAEPAVEDLRAAVPLAPAPRTPLTAIKGDAESYYDLEAADRARYDELIAEGTAAQTAAEALALDPEEEP